MSCTSLLRVAFLLMVFLAGCTTNSAHSLPLPATLVPAEELPSFTDDLELEGLSLAVQRQLAVLRREGDREGLRIGQVSYRTRELRESLERFNLLLSETKSCLKTENLPTHCYDALSKRISEQFLVYLVDASLLTGYYTPTIEVSTKRTKKYRYPIYRTPDSARERRFSRDDIDFEHKLDGKGYEIYYAADRFDLYVIHIEGGARVVVHDNGRRYSKYLHYNADNGQEFTNLGEYMVSQGMLRSNQRSRWDQRAYLERHPEKVRQILTSCPGYVYFKVNDRPAIASTGASLTANRSIASDPSYYAVKGVIAYVLAPIPLLPADKIPPESNPKELDFNIMGRFFIDQDIGHFITGPARADLFFGEGPYAEFLSNNFMTRGSIYLLISK